MLIRSVRQLVGLLATLALFTTTIFVFKLYDGSSLAIPAITEGWGDGDFLNSRTAVSDLSSGQDTLNEDEFDLEVYGQQSHEIFSISGKRGKYFPVVFPGYPGAYNPNIIPHPGKPDTYIVVAQQQRTDVPMTVWFAQLVCEAKITRGKLVCTTGPLLLPIAPTVNDGRCTGDLTFLSYNVGPHDARVFYGPNAPYVVYGSQSKFNCFGQWIQDLRFITDWGLVPGFNEQWFREQTELQRPLPYGDVEKNWFLFWDTMGQLYAHYDIYPKRAFARISADGSAGIDIAPLTAAADEKCMARYMPKLAPTLESIHQATNSLTVTLCKRSDPACVPSDANTFIMTIFQFKSFHQWHGAYEPYVMLFQRSAPFAVHGISQKPLWFHGRKEAKRPEYAGPDDVWNQTEMFYVTSVNWKGQNNMYHGYLDDELFFGFGIEDHDGGAIDVKAEDVLEHMGLCSDIVGGDSIANPVIPDFGSVADSLQPPVVPDPAFGMAGVSEAFGTPLDA